MPTKDIYDTQIMAMAVNAAKDMYNLRQKQIENFNKFYGDFYTPIDKDAAWYKENVLDKVRGAIADLYDRGIDPLRSAEGGAYISRLINSIDIGAVNQLKQSAKNAEEYLANIAKLQAENKYLDDYERVFLGNDLSEWDTINGGKGVWNRRSPSPIDSLKDATSSWFDKRTAGDLSKEEMEQYGYSYDPRYNYSGYLYNRLYDTAGKNLPGFLATDQGRYYAELAKRQIAAENAINGNPNAPITYDQIMQRLQRNVADSNREYIIDPQKKADEFILDDYRTRNDIKAHAANAAIDDKYAAIKHRRENPQLYDKDGNLIINNGDGGYDVDNSLEDHDGVLWRSGVSNLFGGKDSSYKDFFYGQEGWLKDYNKVEQKILGETTTKGSDGRYHINWNNWVGRHMSPWNEKSFVERTRRETTTDPNGKKSGLYVPIVSNDIKELVTEQELGARNANPSIRNMAKHRENKGDIYRTAIINNINTPGYEAKMHGRKKIFTLVEKDGKLHLYEVVGITANDSHLGVDKPFVMYREILTSDEGSMFPSASSYPERMPSNFSATNPTAASKKQAWESTHSITPWGTSILTDDIDIEE